MLFFLINKVINQETAINDQRENNDDDDDDDDDDGVDDGER